MTHIKATNKYRSKRLPPVITVKPCLLLTQVTVYDCYLGPSQETDESEQHRLLNTIRVNRLIETFVGFSCKSIWMRPRITLDPKGLVAPDDVYFGKHKHVGQVIIPVMAFARHSPIEINNVQRQIDDYNAEYGMQPIIPIAAQYIETDLIALFAFEHIADTTAITDERHYRLVPPYRLALGH